MPCFHVVVSVFFVFIIRYITQTSATDCNGIILKESEAHQPLFLINKTENNIHTFFLPKNGKIVLKNGEKLNLLCTNSRNFLRNSNSNFSSALCTQNKIKVANRLYDINELQCNKSVRGDIEPTNKKCGNNEGYLTNIGYYIGRKEFLTLIEICYDSDMGNTLYAEHIVHGESIKNASRSNIRPGFGTQGLGEKITASVAYKRAFQKSTFNKILGSSALADLYINSKSYLSRGHLAPDADFLFAAWQYTTYFYINVSPQWQIINGGNWHRIESMVRNVAAKVGENLRIITGTYGVLSLPDVNNNLQPIYLLSYNRIPVPEYFWKFVYDNHNEHGIVIISSNNPFIKHVNSDDYFCKSICSNYGWEHKYWIRPDKGFVHCCEYKNFIKIVHTLPNFKVRNVLHGPNRSIN